MATKSFEVRPEEWNQIEPNTSLYIETKRGAFGFEWVKFIRLIDE